MLFSPRNELNKTVFFLLFVATCLGHIVLLGLLFFLEGYLSKPKSIIFDLKSMGSKVSMLSGPSKGKGHGSKVQPSAQQMAPLPEASPNKLDPVKQDQVAQQKPPVQAVQPPEQTAAKELVKPEPIPPKKLEAVKQKPEKKPAVKDIKSKKLNEAKKPVEKVAAKKPVVKKKIEKAIPEKKKIAPKNPVAQPKKPAQLQKPDVKPVQAEKKAEVTKKTAELVGKAEAAGPKKSAEPIVKELNVAQAVSASQYAGDAGAEPESKEFSVAEVEGTFDEFTKEIVRHLTVPPGIDDFDAFRLTFDLDDKGKVVNLKPRGKEPLVIYTAFKDALLKSSLPIKNRTNVTLVIN